MIDLKTNFFGAYLGSLVNGDKLSVYGEHLRIAINSCKKNTQLKTYMMYTGDKTWVYDWLTSKGVVMVDCNNTPLVQNIRAGGNNTQPLPQSIALGAWLRIEIPRFLDELKIKDSHILYTDVDVVFTEKWSPTVAENITKFACAQEGDCTSHYNTGVMIMNTNFMKETYTNFTNFIISKGVETFHPSDQGALNDYYPFSTITRLSRRFWNWTPYMGHGHLSDMSARIIHFHGPKLDFIRSKGTLWPRGEGPQGIIHYLYDFAPGKYEKLLQYAEGFLHE